MTRPDPLYWLAVACADHVARGRAGGFMQVCHGRAAPLRRIAPGDGVIYYSPSRTMGVKDGFQSFTAIGCAAPGDPYQVTMADGFRPFRRDVLWQPGRTMPMRDIAGSLDLTRPPHWGYALRRGLLPLTQADFARIGTAMAELDKENI